MSVNRCLRSTPLRCWTSTRHYEASNTHRGFWGHLHSWKGLLYLEKGEPWPGWVCRKARPLGLLFFPLCAVDAVVRTVVLQDGYIPVAELRTVLMKEGPAPGSLALPGHIWTLRGYAVSRDGDSSQSLNPWRIFWHGKNDETWLFSRSLVCFLAWGNQPLSEQEVDELMMFADIVRDLRFYLVGTWLGTWLDVGKPTSTVPRKAMASLSTRAFCGGSATLMLYNNQVRGHGDVTDVVQHFMQKNHAKSPATVSQIAPKGCPRLPDISRYGACFLTETAFSNSQRHSWYERIISENSVETASTIPTSPGSSSTCITRAEMFLRSSKCWAWDLISDSKVSDGWTRNCQIAWEEWHRQTEPSYQVTNRCARDSLVKSWCCDMTRKSLTGCDLAAEAKWNKNKGPHSARGRAWTQPYGGPLRAPLPAWPRVFTVFLYLNQSSWA